MNYVTQTIINILNERFENNQSYLQEKLEELNKHTNKYDGLDYLCTWADKVTVEMYAEKTDLTVEDINVYRKCGVKFNDILVSKKL